MKREVSPLKKHIEDSPKLRALREKNRRRRMRVALLLAVILLVLLGGFIYLSHLPRITLYTVTVAGNKVVDTEDIITAVDADLAGNYAYVIPKRNAFLYPKERIIADLMKAFPRFKSVLVYRTDENTLLVTVEEVRGRALWCGTDASVSNATCYFTDDLGRIVSEAPQYSGNVYPRFYGGVFSEDVDQLGQKFTDEENFVNLLAFEERVKLLGFQIRAIVIGPADENSLMLDFGAGSMAPLRFKKNTDFITLAENLEAALRNPELANSVKTNKANLEYFDLRFENKVYYRFSDGK